MILDAFIKEFKKAKSRGWKDIYVFVDLHETCVEPNYTPGEITTEFYPYAKETLQLMTKRPDIKLVMWTSSHPKEINQYIRFFIENQIEFLYVNENPEVTTQLGGYGNYDKKPYMNILIDDKAGFDPIEWKDVHSIVQEIPQL